MSNLSIGILCFTALQLGCMFLGPYWGFSVVPPFRRLKQAHDRLAWISVETKRLPLKEFVKKEEYGNKITVYHHLLRHVEDFLSAGARQAFQYALVLAIAGAMVLVLLNSSVVELKNPGNLDLVATLVGATDLLALISYSSHLGVLVNEVDSYRGTIEI